MPIYEYTCKDCGSRFDMLRAIKDADSPVTCSVCHSEQTLRMISVFFAQSGGKVVAGSTSGGGCGSCSGGSCSSCGH